MPRRYEQRDVGARQRQLQGAVVMGRAARVQDRDQDHAQQDRENERAGVGEDELAVHAQR